MKAGLAWFGLVVAAAVALVFWRAAADLRTAPPAVSEQLQIPSQAAGRFAPEVRVNLTDSPAEELRISIDGPFRITPVGSSRVLGEGPRLAETSVYATETGFQVGEHEYQVTRLEITADRPPALWVEDHQYRGRIRLFRQPRGRIVAVNVVPLEDYVASVLDSEMPADFPQAARQAQAIVARTYALYQMQEARDHPFYDVHASTRSQCYLGVQYRDGRGRRLAAESESSRRTTAETAGMVCTSDGAVFSTYYTAVCGGRTTTGREVFRDAAPPVVSVPCDWCRDSPLYRWTTEIDRAQLHAALERLFSAKRQTLHEISSIRVSADSPPDGVPTIVVRDGARTLTVSAADLRRELPSSKLHSARFEIRELGDRVRFEGRGHGHGVGFCQWGARGQALAGHPALEIVRYYYPGAEIVALQPGTR